MIVTPTSTFGAANGELPSESAANSAPIVGTLLDGAGSINTLTLAEGMTAGYGVNDGNYSNPLYPYNSQSGQALQPYGGDPTNWPITRIGQMRNVPNTLPPPPNNAENWPGYYTLYFLYNPNQIQASFITNINNIPPLYLYGEQGANAGSTFGGSVTDGLGTGSGIHTVSQGSSIQNVANLTQGQSISWSLIFDRTYDLLYQSNPDTNRGVLKDTAALYNIMGTFESTGAVPVSTPVQVVFAQTADGEVWGFTGYITSVNITYGIFRHNMIPSRCEVDLQMMTTYVAPQTPQATVAPVYQPSGSPTVPFLPPLTGG